MNVSKECREELIVLLSGWRLFEHVFENRGCVIIWRYSRETESKEEIKEERGIRDGIVERTDGG